MKYDKKGIKSLRTGFISTKFAQFKAYVGSDNVWSKITEYLTVSVSASNFRIFLKIMYEFIIIDNWLKMTG